MGELRQNDNDHLYDNSYPPFATGNDSRALAGAAPSYYHQSAPSYVHDNGYLNHEDGVVHHSVSPAVESLMWQSGATTSPGLYQYPDPSGSTFASSSGTYYDPSFHHDPVTYQPRPAPLIPQQQPSQTWYSNPASTTVGEMVSNLAPPAREPAAPSSLSAAGSASFAVASAAANNKIKPFIELLHGILANPELYADCLAWDDDGTTFIVSHCARLIQDVLPRHFQHSNLQSFTRQLNVYEFTRLPTPALLEKLDLTATPNTANFSGWTHPAFTREATKNMLATMKPRPSKARQLKKAAKQSRLEDEARRNRELHRGVGGGVGGSGSLGGLGGLSK